MATEAKPLTLAYWGFRGYGAPSRMLLHFVDAKFDDVIYNKPPGLVWKEKKFNLGFDFPNLPYLIDGDFKLAQSITILRYLGKKYGLAGSTPQEAAELDMFGDVLNDWRSPLYGVFFLPRSDGLFPRALRICCNRFLHQLRLKCCRSQ